MNNLQHSFPTRWQYEATISFNLFLFKLLAFLFSPKIKSVKNNNNKITKPLWREKNNLNSYEISISSRPPFINELFPLFHEFHYLLLMFFSTPLTWASLSALSYIMRIFPLMHSLLMWTKVCKSSWLTSHRSSASLLFWTPTFSLLRWGTAEDRNMQIWRLKIYSDLSPGFCF